MKNTILFAVLCFYCLLFPIKSQKILQKSAFDDSIKKNHEDLEWISKYLTRMMINSQTLQTNGKLDVTVFLINYSKWNRAYEGLQTTMSNFSNNSIIFTSITFAGLRTDMKADFVIILTTSDNLDYEKLLVEGINVMFISKHSKFIIVIRNWHNKNEILTSLWTQMSHSKYFNVYFAIEIKSGSFFIYRTVLTSSRLRLMKIGSHNQNDKYITIRETVNGTKKAALRILTYDSFPTSFTKNNKILGVDGYLIDEFVSKLQTSYINIHPGDQNPTAPALMSYLSNSVDICLCAQYNIQSKKLDSVWLNEIDGVCLLVPRNIHVSSYDNFTSEIDRPTIILAIVSLLIVIICWKIISMHSEHRLSTLEIIIAVVKLAIFSDVDGMDRMNLKEKFLIFSFMFASFFMHNLYEGSILSFMMTDPSVRSAKDIEELNNSGTKFYSYFNEKLSFTTFPKIRKELILNEIDAEGSISLNLPKNFDENLVYMVACRFAENFVASNRNYRNDRRLYDIIKITQFYKRYTVRNGFMFIDEFSSLVTASIESGIRSYWTRETYRLSGDFSTSIKAGDNTERNFIEFRDLAFPIILLFVGTCLALLEFVAELVYSYMMLIQSRRSRVAPLQVYRASRMVANLHKWADKYSKNNSRSIKIKEKLSSKEDVAKVIMRKKREIIKRAQFSDGMLKGGYMIPKKFKQRLRIRKVKVAPMKTEINKTGV